MHICCQTTLHGPCRYHGNSFEHARRLCTARAALPRVPYCTCAPFMLPWSRLAGCLHREGAQCAHQVGRWHVQERVDAWARQGRADSKSRPVGKAGWGRQQGKTLPISGRTGRHAALVPIVYYYFLNPVSILAGQPIGLAYCQHAHLFIIFNFNV